MSDNRDKIPICNMCNLAYRHGDPMEMILLAPGDREGCAHGYWIMCQDCIKEMKPIIARRLGVVDDLVDTRRTA